MLLAQAPDLNQKITFSSTADPIYRVLKKLDGQTGLTLKADPGVANDVIVVDVRDVPVRDLMNHIASVLTAKWVNGTTLRRTPDLVKKRKEADVAEATREAAPTVEKWRKAARSLAPWTPEMAAQWVREAKAQDQRFPTKHRAEITPIQRLLARTLAALTADELGNIDPSRPTIFTNHPTDSQRPFPGDALDAYEIEQKSLDEEIAKIPLPDNPTRDQMFQIIVPPPALPKAPWVMLTLSESNQNLISANLEVADESGHVIDAATQTERIEPVIVAAPSSVGANDTLVSFSKISQSYLDFLKEMLVHHRLGVAEHPDLRAFFSDPAKNEPLQLLIGDSFLSTASSRQENLVANPPDMALFQDLGLALNDKLTVQAFAASAEGLGMIFNEKDGWLEARQARPIDSDRYRFDRVALGKLITTATASHRLRLSDLAAYARTQDSSLNDNLAVLFVISLVPELVSSVNNSDTTAMARLYGALKPEELAALASGKAITFDRLNPDAQAELTLHTYRSGVRMHCPPHFKQGNELSAEPTTCLVAGIPNGAVLTAAVEKTQEVFGKSSKGAAEPWALPIEASQLAFYEFESTHPISQLGQPPPVPDQFYLGSVTKWTFTFNYAPDCAWQQSASDIDFDPQAPPIAFDQLPQDYRDSVNQALKNLEENKGLYAPSRGPQPPPST